MEKIHPIISEVTDQIIRRSTDIRRIYLNTINDNRFDGPARQHLNAGNQAHAYAGCALLDKTALLGAKWPNIGIITSYNDMLSAHAPYAGYPEIIKAAARKNGATAQVAGGVPAMCDGVTQGTQGMELSLFSRDVIAMSTAIALSHNTYDAALYLGVCDKIVPGLLIGALQYGHIPGVFIPAGPMPSGLPNKEKVRVRQLFAEGKVGRDALLKAETQSYHSPGTCTFYGTANSNQMLMEIAGLHIPGAAFVNPGNDLRQNLTEKATKAAIKITALGDHYTPIADVISEKTIVNMIVGLMATGGSTNHTLHIPAIARAAGIHVTWDDFDAISKVTPSLTQIYPNGQADVNHFHAAGGMGFLIRQLLDAGLVHNDVKTILGEGLYAHTREAVANGNTSSWRDALDESLDENVLRPVTRPFHENGGLKLLDGPLGRGVIKVSAVDEGHHVIQAPAKVFDDQDAMLAAFEAGELKRDMVAIVRFQGPAANGMPELHKLTPALGVLQDRGFKVALVTDGRMSGASGKIPAAIHVTPEAANGGPLAKVKDGDMITLDAVTGELKIDVDPARFAARTPAVCPRSNSALGHGRDMFAVFRQNCSSAETGAGIFGHAL